MLVHLRLRVVAAVDVLIRVVLRRHRRHFREQA
jgi:hypothetical protein